MTKLFQLLHCCCSGFATTIRHRFVCSCWLLLLLLVMKKIDRETPRKIDMGCNSCDNQQLILGRTLKVVTQLLKSMQQLGLNYPGTNGYEVSRGREWYPPILASYPLSNLPLGEGAGGLVLLRESNHAPIQPATHLMVSKMEVATIATPNH